jgi:hypothetical protein
VSTDLADATEDGAGGDDGTGGTSSETGGTGGTGGTSSETGGTGGTGGTSPETGGTGGTSPETGGTGGTSPETGGTAGTAGTNPSGGTSGAQCWDPTVQNYCTQFDCPVSAQAPAWPSEEEIRQHYRDTGACDEHTVMMDRDTCGGVMIGYDSGSTADSYLSISGTLGATYRERETPFGPCNQTSYYGGIEPDEWYAMCNVEARCVVCGPPLPDGPQYPACRFDCDCSTVGQPAEPCSDPESCECYCSQITVDGG